MLLYVCSVIHWSRVYFFLITNFLTLTNFLHQCTQNVTFLKVILGSLPRKVPKPSIKNGGSGCLDPLYDILIDKEEQW